MNGITKSEKQCHLIFKSEQNNIAAYFTSLSLRKLNREIQTCGRKNTVYFLFYLSRCLISKYAIAYRQNYKTVQSIKKKMEKWVRWDTTTE